MADKEISSLPAATSITNADLFVLQQSGTAKSLTGAILRQYAHDIESASINAQGHLILTLKGGETVDAGTLPAGPGTGDMLASIYDAAQGRKQVAFKDETDAAIAAEAAAREAKDTAQDGSIATLALRSDNVVNPKLLVNGDFRAGCLVDQRQGRVLKPNTAYYSDKTLTTMAGTTSAYVTAYRYATGTENGTAYASFKLTDTDAAPTYYAAPANVVHGYVGVGYGIDMWKTEGSGTVTITDDGITLQKASGAEYFVFETFLERSRVNAADTVSLSVLTGSALHALAGTIQAGIVVVSLTANINDRFEIYDVDALPSVHIARFVIVSDTPVLLRACKLELGDQQTLAHQDSSGNWVLNEVPSYADTLRACQRYFQRIKASYGYMRFGASQPYTNTLSGVIVPFLSEMRTTPTVAASGSFALFDGTTFYDVALTLDTASPYNVVLKAAGTGLPSVSAQLLAKGDINAYIDFSAEL